MMAGLPTRRSAPAMTLVEVVIAMAVLSIVLVSLLQGSAVSVRMQHSAAHEVTAAVLARELLDAVSALPYDDPDGDAGPGLDAGELAADRTTFDDLDDFAGWTESPPRRPDGAVMPGLADWERRVAVARVSPVNLAASLAAQDPGAKRVRVTVLRDGQPLCTLDRVRYRAADGAKQ